MRFGVVSCCSDVPPSFPAGHRVDSARRVHQVQLPSLQAPAVSVSLGIIPHRAPGSDLPGPWAFPRRHRGLGWTPDPQFERTGDEVGTEMLQYPPSPKKTTQQWGGGADTLLSSVSPCLRKVLPTHGQDREAFPGWPWALTAVFPSPAASCPPDVTTLSCSTSRMTGARTTWKLG